MEELLGILAVVAAFAVVVFLWGTGIYNALVTLRNLVKTAFAQIDVQLQRRYDLIPNLVEVAKKYMAHERETFEAVINARNAAANASHQVAENPTDGVSMKELISAEQTLGGTLGRLFALREDYPELKADTQMTRLMDELADTENKVSYSRQAYNDAVMKYNTKREMFPSSVIAGVFNFLPADLYKADNDDVRQVPKVEF